MFAAGWFERVFVTVVRQHMFAASHIKAQTKSTAVVRDARRTSGRIAGDGVTCAKRNLRNPSKHVAAESGRGVTLRCDGVELGSDALDRVGALLDLCVSLRLGGFLSCGELGDLSAQLPLALRQPRQVLLSVLVLSRVH